MLQRPTERRNELGLFLFFHLFSLPVRGCTKAAEYSWNSLAVGFWLSAGKSGTYTSVYTDPTAAGTSLDLGKRGKCIYHKLLEISPTRANVFFIRKTKTDKRGLENLVVR